MRSKKRKKIKPNKAEAVFKESHVMILLEDMRDDIKLIAETQGATIKELRGFKVETKDNFNAVFKYQSRFSDEVYERFNCVDERFNRMDERFDRMDERFNRVDERFNRMDSELAEIKKELKKINKNKVNIKKFNLLEKRITKLERELKKYKYKIAVRKERQVASKVVK